MNKRDKINFAGGIWHGAFLAFSSALTQPTTVISALIAALTGSTIWVGGLSTVLNFANSLPQIFAARWIEPRAKKMPYLLMAIYLRAFSWGALALLIYLIGSERPTLLAWALVVFLSIFYAGGGIGNIPYTDIIGKVIPLEHRGAFFGGRSAIAGPLSIGAAFLAKKILAVVSYPKEYALLFGIASAGIFVASIGFLIIKEPKIQEEDAPIPPWKEYFGSLSEAARALKPLIITQLLTGFSLMILPFYVVFAQKELGAPSSAVGIFLLAQVTGGVVANLGLWARLVDKYESRTMLFVCATLSTLTPLLAIFLARFGWKPMTLVFLFAGACFNGRNVGFQTALLEISPPKKRPTYTAINAALVLPLAILPLLGGIFLKYYSYPALFGIAAFFIALGAFSVRKIPHKPPLREPRPRDAG